MRQLGCSKRTIEEMRALFNQDEPDQPGRDGCAAVHVLGHHYARNRVQRHQVAALLSRPSSFPDIGNVDVTGPSRGVYSVTLATNDPLFSLVVTHWELIREKVSNRSRDNRADSRFQPER